MTRRRSKLECAQMSRAAARWCEMLWEAAWVRGDRVSADQLARSARVCMARYHYLLEEAF